MFLTKENDKNLLKHNPCKLMQLTLPQGQPGAEVTSTHGSPVSLRSVPHGFAPCSTQRSEVACRGLFPGNFPCVQCNIRRASCLLANPSCPGNAAGSCVGLGPICPRKGHGITLAGYTTPGCPTPRTESASQGASGTPREDLGVSNKDLGDVRNRKETDYCRAGCRQMPVTAALLLLWTRIKMCGFVASRAVIGVSSLVSLGLSYQQHGELPISVCSLNFPPEAKIHLSN